jgi:uncharacterized membrane protein
MQGFGNKLKAIFYGPGWNPVPKKNEEEITYKYAVKYTSTEIVYMAVLLLEIIAFAATVLFTYKDYNTETLTILVGIILITMWSIGNLADKKSYAKWVEIGRVLLFSVFIFQLDQFTEFGQWGITVIFTSLLLLILLFKKEPQPNA